MQYEDSLVSIILYVRTMYSVIFVLHEWFIVDGISRCKNKGWWVAQDVKEVSTRTVGYTRVSQ